MKQAQATQNPTPAIRRIKMTCKGKDSYRVSFLPPQDPPCTSAGGSHVGTMKSANEDKQTELPPSRQVARSSISSAGTRSSGVSLPPASAGNLAPYPGRLAPWRKPGSSYLARGSSRNSSWPAKSEKKNKQSADDDRGNLEWLVPRSVGNKAPKT